MNIARKNRNLIIWAYVAAVVCGLGGFASRVAAENAVSPPAGGSESVAVSALQGASAFKDGALERRVKAALHADPYFYDEHVTVSIEHGAVVLHGFVFGASDSQDAIRIASRAAGGRRVVDDLSIDTGGRR